MTTALLFIAALATIVISAVVTARRMRELGVGQADAPRSWTTGLV